MPLYHALVLLIDSYILVWRGTPVLEKRGLVIVLYTSPSIPPASSPGLYFSLCWGGKNRASSAHACVRKCLFVKKHSEFSAFDSLKLRSGLLSALFYALQRLRCTPPFLSVQRNIAKSQDFWDFLVHVQTVCIRLYFSPPQHKRENRVPGTRLAVSVSWFMIDGSHLSINYSASSLYTGRVAYIQEGCLYTGGLLIYRRVAYIQGGLLIYRRVAYIQEGCL